MTSQPASTGTGGKPQGPLPPLLLTLTVVTGVVDAVSILRLGRVFVANMTGNVVFSGFALVGAPGFSLSASLAALAGFLVGALAGGVLAGRLGRDRGLLLRAGAAAELVLVAGALALTAGPPGEAARDGIAALLALAMGIQNAVARRLAVPDLTTTVLDHDRSPVSRPTCGRRATGWPCCAAGSSRWRRCSPGRSAGRCSCSTRDRTRTRPGHGAAGRGDRGRRARCPEARPVARGVRTRAVRY